MRLIKFINFFKFKLGFLYKLIPFSFNFLKQSSKNKNIFLYVQKEDIIFLAKFLFYFSYSKAKILNDICVVDYYKKKNRFKVVYNLTSLNYGHRVLLSSFLNEANPMLYSLTFLFKSANWLEREVWDLFGIYFFEHKDLRRILTDYGFKGYPFRKDFPLTGYIELRFDDSKGDIVYEPVELAQELRFFNFSSGWEIDY